MNRDISEDISVVEEQSYHSRKKFSFPNTFVVMLGTIIFCIILTFIITPAEYTRTTIAGKTLVDASSFHYLPPKELTLSTLLAGATTVFTSIPSGFSDASALIFMMLFIGGFVKVYDSTGAIQAALTRLVDIVGEERKQLVLVAVFLFFGCLGAFPGLLEACIPFAPITIGIAMALGYDALIGIFVTLGGITLGFCAGPTNIWNTGVGNQLAEMPMFSGLWYRMIVFAIFMAVGSFWVLRYTKKITRNPASSPIYHVDMSALQKSVVYKREQLTMRRKVVLGLLVATIGVIIYGSLYLKWGPIQMAAMYLFSSIICAAVNKYDSNKMVQLFLEGMNAILIGAVAVGVSRALPLILQEGKIMDTLIHAVVQVLGDLPDAVTAVMMMLVQAMLNFLMPSSAGQAVATLPLFLPIGDLIGLGRQVVILAFQFGDSLTNLLYPTYGGLMAFLLFAHVPYSKWVKFILPFMGIIISVAAVLLAIAVLINF